MKTKSKLALLLIAASLYAVEAHAQSNDYRIYYNNRFGYSIEYPANLLIPQGESDNGDGQTFLSPDGKSKAIVYAGYDVLGESLTQLYNRDLKSRKGVTYKLLRQNFFVISGIEDDQVFYRKTFCKKNIIYTFEISYPAAEKPTYDAVTTKMSKSFR
ncbi:MAG: hypothetical protein RMM17_02400 [Acidobacteriota bacterium]|nr:hypothetical protein [Blastocatellia bacterium]MDW8411518.1 hypothetical protein [Acidobacteriota bacterium]